MQIAGVGIVKRRRKGEVGRLILIPGNSHKFARWPVSDETSVAPAVLR